MEERRFPPPPPPRPDLNGGQPNYNQTQPNQNYSAPQQNYAQPNQTETVIQEQSAVENVKKKEKQPLDPKTRKILCIVGASISFVIALVCLVLLFVL